MKLVKNASKGYKMWSNQAAAATGISAIIEAAHGAISETLPIWEAFIPEGTFAVLAAVLATTGIFLRHLDQGLE